MAGGVIGTNVTADGSAEYDMLSKIFNALEEMYLKAGMTEEARNVRTIANHIAAGGDGSYKLVPRKFEKEMREALKDAKIPFTVLYDDSGNAAFAVRDVDFDKFEKVQHDVFSMSTDYYAQMSLKNLARIAKNNGEKEVIKISFGDTTTDSQTREADFQEAQVKLYGNGVVCARGIEENTLCISPSDLYRRDGKDFTKFELEWAINQSMDDEMFGAKDGKHSELQDLRDAQARHDLEQIRNFSNAIQNGEDRVLVDATNKSPIYLECGKNGLGVYTRNEKGVWKETGHYSKDDLSNLSKEDIGAIISKWGFDIHDAIIVEANDKDNILKSQSKDAMNWAKDWVKGNLSEEKTTLSKSLRPTLEDISPSFRITEANTLKTTELRKVFDAVDEKARDLVAANAKAGMSSMELRALYKQEVQNILTVKDLKEIQDFLNAPENSTISREDREKWIDNIANHFKNEHEFDQHELNIENYSIKNLEKEAKEEERRKSREQERKQEEERSRQDEQNKQEEKEEEPVKEE